MFTFALPLSSGPLKRSVPQGHLETLLKHSAPQCPLSRPSSETLLEERGAIMVVALVVMSALIMMGSLAMMITVTETNISRNLRMAKEAFYVADGGYPLAVAIIEEVMNQVPCSSSRVTVDEHLPNEVMDYYRDNVLLNDYKGDSPENSPDITTSFLTHTLSIDIDRTHTSVLYGGAAAFGAGGENIGVGGGACKKILFEITSEGRMKGGALSRVITVYRKIL